MRNVDVQTRQDYQAPLRQLGVVHVSAVFVGTVIGAGIFMNVPIVARTMGDPWFAALAWLLGGFLWLPAVFILAEMGTAFPEQGGAYRYLERAGWRPCAFLYGWIAFLAVDTLVVSLISLLAASELDELISRVGIPFPTRSAVASGLILIFTFIQYRNVKQGASLQVVLSLLKFVPFAILIIFAIYLLGFEQGARELSPPQVYGTIFNVLPAGVAATVLAYSGFFNTLYMAGEIRDPQYVLPKSLVGSLFVVIATYMLVVISIQAIAPFSVIQDVEEGKLINPFAFVPFVGSHAVSAFNIIIFCTLVGVLNAALMAQPRLPYAMARDGLFFQKFGVLHSRHGTPHTALFLQAGLAIVMCIAFGERVEELLGYFTAAYGLQNALLFSSIFALRRKPNYNPQFQVKFWPIVAILAICFQLLIAVSVLDVRSGLTAIGLGLLGISIYFIFVKRFADRSFDRKE